MKKKTIISAIGFALILCGCARPELQDVTLEYGDTLDPALFLKEDTDKLITLKTEDGTGIPAVMEPGTYKMEVSLDGKSAGQAELTIHDTTPPKINAPQDTIQIAASAAKLDETELEQAMDPQDLSDITVTIEDDQVVYGTPGQYPATVIFTDKYDNAAKQEITVEITEDAPAATYSTIVKGILIVNKKHPISADYDPGNDPVASAAVSQLIADMQAAGMDVSHNTSGYRDYNYQASLYNSYVAADGQQAADTYSARPGYSEHQTGLTFDLMHSDGSLITRDPEASWLKNHAADYGFIIRYPEGKQDITGYSPEPWHLRYVGKEAAREIMDNGLTLEQYLGVEGGDYYN